MREGHTYPDPEPPRPGPGRMRPTGWRPLVVVAVVGALLGFAVRPVAQWLGETAPTVGLLQVGALYFLAAVLAALAWQTWRTLHRQGGTLEPHRAVNRLLVAKSCALVGALAGGAYGGYAAAFLDRFDVLLGRERVVNSTAGVVACALVVTAALVLERACRTRGDASGDLP
ncbi:hypothetical protein J2S59_000684 [Nocardioides massiliensis]|uniref:DUF3180 domain-containing protein n=3 Tax=Nocardioides massiliensis TaxID=1325935 RepID=A0ABT9NLG1_9ACTN|nr:DUF3180 domain-containing protein [Nocardioides massiliensis]MDP9820875.1 hypothetical protein [Nocardioides massiliensis]